MAHRLTETRLYVAYNNISYILYETKRENLFLQLIQSTVNLNGLFTFAATTASLPEHRNAKNGKELRPAPVHAYPYYNTSTYVQVTRKYILKYNYAPVVGINLYI